MDDPGTIRDKVIHYLLEASDEDLGAADVKPESSLRNDLDLSSMQAITLVMDLEDEFGFTVEDEELASLETVGDVLALIETKKSAA